MSEGRNIGVMGGSFNPVHIGHLLLADYLTQFAGLDEVWLMLSPLNPIKASPEELIDDRSRLQMLRIACRHTPAVKPCDVELTMPRPSYSIDSLSRLAELNPDCRLHLIIGSDNWLIFDRWRDWQEIISRFSPIIYPRPGYDIDPDFLPEGVSLIKAPTFDISSTFLREAIASGHDMRPYLPEGVWDYITTHNLYKTSLRK